MYIKLGHYNEACSELKTARTCFRELGTPPDIIRAGESALELAVSWGFTLEPGKRIQKLIYEAQADLKDDPKGAARALMELGYNYWYMGMHLRALEHLANAKAALLKLNCTAELAHCSFLMSRCYAHQKALPEWLRAAEESVEASRRVGMNDLIAQALRTLSRCRIVLEQYDIALGVLKEAFIISEALGHPLAIAQVLELSGYAYAKSMDFIGALKAYEEAKKVYAGMEKTHQTTSCDDRCGRNIRLISESDSVDDLEVEAPMLY
jgi:tetratricopeptide (TPR) repeat protein